MTNYRFYRLDRAGKITKAEWIEASGEDDAVQQARVRGSDGSFELWQKTRLIERRGLPGAAAE